jgi:aspartate aminotransferase
MSILARNFTPARRLDGLAVSEIVQIKQRASALARQGRDIIDLSIGEPDFPTPHHIQIAAEDAMHRGETHYTATAGTLALREAIARKVVRDNHRQITTGEIVVCVGAKQVISNALLATIELGDEVVIPTPFWSNYADMVRFAGGTPVFVHCPSTAGFVMTPEQLDQAITPRTRWLLLNSPSNPTGACYGHAQLSALTDVLVKHPHVGVIEDAIYEHILFDATGYCSVLDVAPSLVDRTLWVNGVSKAYAMTGWRIGYGVGPKPLIDAMTVVSAQTTSHPCSIAQAASIAALDGDQSVVETFRQTFERRRAIVCRSLGLGAGVTIVEPRGAFYLFPDIQQLLARHSARFANDRALIDFLLEDAGVALVPGSSFGAPGHVRLSFAASDEQLRRACERITGALSPSPAGLRSIVTLPVT